MAGRVLDQLVADQVLAALQPGALELSLAAADDVMRERSALDENWRQRLERGRTQAARIERQYQAAEPENRLVQRTLERRWEEALQEVRRLEEEYARFPKSERAGLGRDEWFVIDLAGKLGIGKNTLHAWLRRGWVRYRRLPGYRGRCVCWADAGELKRLGRLAHTPRGWWDPPLPSELTTPKPLPSKSRCQGE